MYYANLTEAFQVPEKDKNDEEENAVLLQQEVEPVVTTLENNQVITEPFRCKCNSNFDTNHFIIILLLIIIFFKK